MVKRYPRERDRIEVRIRKNLIDIDQKFQQYCIDEERTEAEVIRELIEERINDVEAKRGRPIIPRRGMRLDEFAGE